VIHRWLEIFSTMLASKVLLPVLLPKFLNIDGNVSWLCQVPGPIVCCIVPERQASILMGVTRNTWRRCRATNFTSCFKKESAKQNTPDVEA
jgi:hypothetical protein